MRQSLDRDYGQRIMRAAKFARFPPQSIAAFNFDFWVSYRAGRTRANLIDGINEEANRRSIAAGSFPFVRTCILEGDLEEETS